MRSLRVLRAILSSREVQTSLETFGEGVAEHLNRRHDPPEGGEDGSPDVHRRLFETLGRDLRSLRASVTTAEDAHIRRRAAVFGLKRLLEEKRVALYEQQVSVRRILAGAFGPELGFELAAMSGTTPRTPKALEEQVHQTVKLLSSPVREVPEVRVAGVTIDLEQVAGGLAARLAEFRELRLTLARARKATVESKVDLDRAMDGFKGSFPWIAQVVESHFRLADQHELADLVRAAIRRVTRRRKAAPEEREALAEPSGDAPASPPPLPFPAPVASTPAEPESESPSRAVDDDRPTG